jgi:hypothetical protein
LKRPEICVQRYFCSQKKQQKSNSHSWIKQSFLHPKKVGFSAPLPLEKSTFVDLPSQSVISSIWDQKNRFFSMEENRLPERTQDQDRILPVQIEEQMKTAYIDYSMSVIVGRALPDVRDGLKPVHRRVLFAMNELGINYNKPYKKSPAWRLFRLRRDGSYGSGMEHALCHDRRTGKLWKPGW